MNVLHLSSEQSWRGGEQQLAYLVEGLNKKGVEQWVFCREESAMHAYCKRNEINKYTFIKKSFYSFSAARKCKEICAKHNIDLVHVHDSQSHTVAILSAVLFGNRTAIILSRKVDFPVSSNPFSKYKYNHPQIRKIICVSDAVKKIMTADISNSHLLTVIHDGVNLQRFSKPSTGFLRKKYNLSSDTLIIGNIAAIAPHKDYFTFVDTVELLVNAQLKAKYFIVGDGPERKAIENYIENKKLAQHIILTGFINNIEEVLPEFDIFLFTSKTEGLGSSLLDAALAKVPVVSTNAGGIPEIIKDGETGLLVPVQNPKVLSEKVMLLANNKKLRKELAMNASENVKNFSTDQLTEKTLAVYTEVLSS